MNALVVSALRGGAAEVIARAITHRVSSGGITVENSTKLKREFEEWLDRDGISISHGVFLFGPKQNFEEYVHVVLGTERGIFLADVDYLPKCKLVSLSGWNKKNGGSAEFTVMVSRSILAGTDKEQESHIRRAVNQICAFVLKEGRNLEQLKAGIERKRQARRIAQVKYHAKQQRRVRDEVCFGRLW